MKRIKLFCPETLTSVYCPFQINKLKIMKKNNYKIIQNISILLLVITIWSCSPQKEYDIIIKNGQIIDGSGNQSYKGDIGINADTIAVIGNLKNAKAKKIIDASGLVVAPVL
jgi:hypothetical protein